MFGYHGKILRVNLTSGEFQIETPESGFYRCYVGGRNIGAFYLLSEVPAGIDPISEANKLIFAVSMLTGLSISGCSRSSVVGKSPLTGGYGESEAGGFWPAEFKSSGFDALIIEGKSQNPCYLYIHNSHYEIRSAERIWGKEPKEVEYVLKKELGDQNVRVAQIGLGGENLIPYACICNDLSHFYGRTGLGAVMGSKNLKAVVVRGTQKPKVADPEKIKELASKFNRSVSTHPALKTHQRLGTSKGIMPVSNAGILPTHNFRGGTFDGAEDISGERMEETILKKNDSCYSCAVRCKRVVEYLGEDFNIDPAYGGPEYETIVSFGSNSLVNDIRIIAKANEMCNRYGLDTISTALTITCAMDCFEHGLLTLEDTDGIDLHFGNGMAILQCIEKIANRDGFGALLALGSKHMAQKIGGDAIHHAMQIKGQELPGHEPRGKWGVALGYGLSPTGADHLNAAHDPWFTVDADPKTAWVSLNDIRPLGISNPVPALSLNPEKVRMFVQLQDIWSLINVIDFCLFCMVPEFSIYQLNDIVEAVAAVTGWNTSLLELAMWGERGVNLTRAFNIREGMGFIDDMLPERLHQPLTSGVYKGVAIPKKEYKKAIKLYYQMRGWDEDGKPLPGKLLWLDLGWLVPTLYES